MFTTERSIRSLEWLDLENVEKIGEKRNFRFPSPYQDRVASWYVLNVPGFSIEGLPTIAVGNIYDSELGDILLVTMSGHEALDGVFVYIDLGSASSSDPLLRNYFIVSVEKDVAGKLHPERRVVISTKNVENISVSAVPVISIMKQSGSLAALLHH